MQFRGEMKFEYPVTDRETLVLYVRGVKERVLITNESNSVTIRIYNLSTDAEVEHKSNRTGMTGRIYNFFNINRHTWIVKEKNFECFRITAESGRQVITHVHDQKMYNNDFVITLKF